MLKNLKNWLQWNFSAGGDWGFRNMAKIMIIILAIGGVGYLFFAPDYSRERQIEILNESTIGTAYKIEPKETISQGYTGNNTKILGYTVYYSFQVNNSTYYISEFINNKSNNQKLIYDIMYNLNVKCFTIKYSDTDPNMAMILSKK